MDHNEGFLMLPSKINRKYNAEQIKSVLCKIEKKINY
jgi:hypothetical protein